uniref:Uncharacterized protein n=1 Tax=Aegilops tauschii subsp. strangulata TaxID=200361 RepID=A0A453ECC5_AEGTS
DHVDGHERRRDGGGDVAGSGLVVSPDGPAHRDTAAAPLVQPPQLRAGVQPLALRRLPLLPGVRHASPAQRHQRRLHQRALLQPLLRQELRAGRHAGRAGRQDLRRRWTATDAGTAAPRPQRRPRDGRRPRHAAGRSSRVRLRRLRDYDGGDGAGRMVGVSAVMFLRLQAALSVGNGDGGWTDWGFTPYEFGPAFVPSPSCNPVFHGGLLYLLGQDGRLAVYDQRMHDQGFEILEKPRSFGFEC